MCAQEGSQTKYNYTFTLLARSPGENSLGQQSRAELQSYINEIIGVGKAKRPEDARVSA